MSDNHNHNHDCDTAEPDALPITLQSDCAVKGFAIGDVVYIRGRVVATCKCPWGYGNQIAAQPIDKAGNKLDGTVGVYFIDPRHAVNAETVRAELRGQAQQAAQQGSQAQ